MRKRGSVAWAVVLDVVGQIETVGFKFMDVARGGYVARGVTNPPRMIGHTGVVCNATTALNTELHLGLDNALIREMGLIHDQAKITGDPPRIGVQELQRPSGRISMGLKKLRRKGLSYHDRKANLDDDLRVLGPIYETTPEIWSEISRALTDYHFMRNNEAKLLHGVGQVVDAHGLLWYARTNRMKPTPLYVRYIRLMTDELSLNLRHSAADLYWQVVKERFLDVLLKVYKRPGIALAQ